MCWRMAHGGHQATGTDEGRRALMEGQSQGGGTLTWTFLLVSSLLKLWFYKALILFSLMQTTVLHGSFLEMLSHLKINFRIGFVKII